MNRRGHVFENLTPLRYGGIIADPATEFKTRSRKGEGRSPQRHYRTMTLEEICALPVHELAAPGCLLLMWTTFPLLEKSFEILKAWQFTYITGGAWHKKTKHGKDGFGTGYVLRSASEPFLLGRIGRPPYRDTTAARSVRNIIEAPLQEHSRKPDDAHEIIETLVPGPYCELFARRPYPGWEVWGDELEEAA